MEFRQNFRPTAYLWRLAFPSFNKYFTHQKWRPFWIFEFFTKIAKHKNACISKTVRDRVISAKFLDHRVSVKTSLSKFQRIFHLPKMVAILNFRIFFKNVKHKNACISKTVLDKAISTNFLTRNIALLSRWPSFQRFFVPPKMVAILNFRNACISKTMPDRANSDSAKFLTHRISVKTSLSKFQRIFHSPKTFLHD